MISQKGDKIMGRIGHVVALLGMLASAAQAAETKKPPPTPQNATHKQEARKMMRDFAECLVRKADVPKVKRAMLTLLIKPHGTLDDKQFETLKVLDCRENQDAAFGYYPSLSFEPSLMRGSIFRALYLDIKANRRAFVTAADVAPAWSEADDSRRVTQRFGDCVIAHDRDGADRAITAVATSPGEAEAYAALNPAFAQCVVEGSSIKFSKSVLEGILSEALYKQAAGIAAPATS
jgi:hypothetical protein